MTNCNILKQNCYKCAYGETIPVKTKENRNERIRKGNIQTEKRSDIRYK